MIIKKEQLSLKESFELLASAKIKTPKTIYFTNEKELNNKKIKFPVALKTATGMAHKTNYGLVKSNISNMEELKKSAEQMIIKLKKLGKKPILAVQEIIEGQEVIIVGMINIRDLL